MHTYFTAVPRASLFTTYDVHKLKKAIFSINKNVAFLCNLPHVWANKGVKNSHMSTLTPPQPVLLCGVPQVYAICSTPHPPPSWGAVLLPAPTPTQSTQ